MAGFERKERFDAVYEGENVSVNRVWRGHRFTDEEVEQLKAGETIHFPMTSKAGKPYEAYGYLERQSFTASDGREVVYVGFKLNFDSAPVTLPNSFCKHEFTDEERAILESGKKLHLTDLVSKKGNNFEADLTWDTDPDNPDRKKIILSFE